MKYQPIPQSWNDFSTLSRFRSDVERAWERWFYREQLPLVTDSELRVITFIKSRTLDWQKFAEVIPMSVFLNGLREDDGGYMLDREGERLCSGCGIRKEDTVRDALKRLRARGLITCFPGVRGSRYPANTYMALGEIQLADMLIQAGCGILPRHLEQWWRGEHVRAREGGMWRIADVGGENLVVEEVLSGLEPTGRCREFLPAELFRPSLDDWLSFSVGSNPDRSRPRLAA